MLYINIGTVTLFLATCIAEPLCPNGTIEKENATAIIDKLNQPRRNLADGLQATADGALLPPAKNMSDLQWDCEVEEALIEMTSKLCPTPGGVDVALDYSFFWFPFNPENDGNLLDFLTEELAKIEDEAPTNITSDAVVYNHDNNYGYALAYYSNIVRASTKKFACIKVDGDCYVFDTDNLLLFCATEQPELQIGDIVYEIAKVTTTTTTASITSKPVASSMTTSTSPTITSTSSMTTSISSMTTSTSPMTTSSNDGLNATQCAIPSTTPKCATISSRKLKRDVKAALLANLLMDKSNAPTTGAAKNIHRKQIRHPETPVVLSVRRTRATRKATAKN
ncbi:unnamed protein product [Cylicocyclus nassatus]|uniref:SCP domain-containing protein n=1 Tax=Cylicocyclus nassatus TaxID=53992 RepID=A0AA36H1Q8_CYLNA|nr:unnamed protein product [Cylicocyclus nassatus]